MCMQPVSNVHATTEQVMVPVLRRGEQNSRLEVEVYTEDGSAKLGRNYMPIETTAGAKLSELHQPSTTALAEPGAAPITVNYS